jgi:Gig2-like
VTPWRIDRNHHRYLQNQPTNPELCCTVYKSSPFPRSGGNLDSNLILENMAMLALKTTSNGISTPPPRKRIPKVEGDISSVFASLAGDKIDALPARFAELKREIIGEHGDAILASWKRLIPVVEAKVREANERGPSIFPEVQFTDVQNNNVDDDLIERIKRTGVCIIRNAIPQNETTEILADVRKYIKANPTTKGTLPSNDCADCRIPRQ